MAMEDESVKVASCICTLGVFGWLGIVLGLAATPEIAQRRSGCQETQPLFLESQKQSTSSISSL